jgi:hypothetical protein
MPELIEYQNKWIVSYETLKFSTLDGDLDFNQYATGPEKEYLIRLRPKTESQFQGFQDEELKKLGIDISKFEEVKILEGHCYYDEFRGADGITVRIQSLEHEYKKLATIKDYPQPSRKEMVSEIPVFDDLLPSGDVPNSIVYDTVGNGGGTYTSGFSFNHTVAEGDDRLLVVGVGIYTNYTVSSITYNGDSLSDIRSDYNANAYRTNIRYRIAPDTGTHSVTVALSGTATGCYAYSTSYQGAKQSGQPDAQAGGNNNTTDATVNVTTSADNSWVVAVISARSGNTHSCTHTLRAQNWAASGGEAYCDTNGPKTPAGSVTIGWTISTYLGVSYWAVSAASFAPSVVAGQPASKRMGGVPFAALNRGVW